LDGPSIRLDASAYCTADEAALGDTPTVKLSELALVRQPIIFGKKQMQGSASHGMPLYSSSEMLMQSPEPVYFISRRFETKIRKLLEVAEGAILVSRSGTIGLVTVVTSDRSGFLVDDHMIRIIPKNEKDRGILFTFLSSPIGQKLLDSLAYGAVQKEIKAFQLENIQVPEVSSQVAAQISSHVNQANRLRSQAAITHQTAIAQVLSSNNLPPLVEEGLRPTVLARPVNAWTRKLSTVCGDQELNAGIRLDANFYNRLVYSAISNIKEHAVKSRILGEVSNDVIMGGRFKRNYVEAAQGTPFLSGKSIIQIRPVDMNHLSNTETEGLVDMLVKREWTLVTCSGTVGRTCFVWNNFEDYAASQHILRVLPDKSKVDPGYLYAFLASEYGYQQIIRFRHGAVIDEITDHQLKKVLVPLPSSKQQEDIGNMVRESYEKRAEALRLEDEAQELMMTEIVGTKPGKKDRLYV
jgi:type I restriction enzyme S subunit